MYNSLRTLPYNFSKKKKKIQCQRFINRPINIKLLGTYSDVMLHSLIFISYIYGRSYHEFNQWNILRKYLKITQINIASCEVMLEYVKVREGE